MAVLDFLRRVVGAASERSRRRGVRAGWPRQRRETEPTAQIPAEPPVVTPPTKVVTPPTTVVTPPTTVVTPPTTVETPPQHAGAEKDKTEYVKAIPKVAGVLVGVEGELEGQLFRILDGESKIGRSSHCEIELPSKRISREHAKVIHRDGAFAIKPLSDQNPTFVNDETLPSEGAELKDGDYVRLGRTTLRFRSVV